MEATVKERRGEPDHRIYEIRIESKLMENPNAFSLQTSVCVQSVWRHLDILSVCKSDTVKTVSYLCHGDRM